MQTKPRKIELLAPAKDLNCGIEAINHGADAVYIGAPKFGARSAAGNSLEDIKELCDYAHRFDARIYVTLNTILHEEELKEAEALVWDLWNNGVDALIVQDMSLMKMNLPPIPLHASTQTDNRTAEKVKFLQDAGFTQVVLARELSLNEIRKIADETEVPLEVFVHGALCVSYSGQCYISQALSKRSANRGECAQYCRLPYRMVDAQGKEIIANKHLLSLKDMNRSEQLEDLLDAGVSSLKIEGRLKDVSYVKNITAYYRKKLDEIMKGRPEYMRASLGKCTFTFDPLPEKSFNRGFTSFMLDGKKNDITAFDSPKSIGEPIGRVKEIKGNSFTIAGIKQLNNGDGLVFFNDKGELEGFRVNKVEANRVYPLDMPRIKPKTELYRNFDQTFDKLLSKTSGERKIGITIDFQDLSLGFSLSMTDESGASITLTKEFVKEIAKRDQEENIKLQLSKLGGTEFEVSEVKVNMSENWFVPSSVLAEMRREAINKLIAERKNCYRREVSIRDESKKAVFPQQTLTYLGNVANSRAASFYKDHGVKSIDEAFEIDSTNNQLPLMFSKHCLRYSMGCCPRFQKKDTTYKEPFYLEYKDVTLRLDFDCKNCMMLVYNASKK